MKRMSITVGDIKDIIDCIQYARVQMHDSYIPVLHRLTDESDEGEFILADATLDHLEKTLKWFDCTDTEGIIIVEQEPVTEA